MLVRSIAVAASLGCALPALALQQTAPYPLLDHVAGTMILTNAAPIRPLALDPVSGDVWAVNTSLSTVERFELPLGSGPVDIRPVPWSPVSIAYWEGSGDVTPQLIIACRNTWGLLQMDLASGAFAAFVPLPAEPTDLVVYGAKSTAFVSCMGADAVVKIDLLTGATVQYDEETTTGGSGVPLRLKSPFFLALDEGELLVAPLHSGNNTTVEAGQSPDEVVSLATSTFPLPDQDLFRIDPTPLPENAVSVEATAAGTILFAHGRNPASGEYWILNSDARNADPDAQSEPALEFDLGDNRVARLSSTHVPPGAPASFIGLDPDAPGFSLADAVGQPFALEFHAAEERAFVAGLLTDNVVMLDGLTGALQEEIELPDGALPRGMRFSSPESSLLLVYCWGTSEVRGYTIDFTTNTATPAGASALSHEPLPADLRNGRAAFFDGHNSALQNVSCATCHIEGGTDFLAWNLSGSPFDLKGPMVTQPLLGLERVRPFHWRGERTLEDFNTFAFPGLLGGAPLTQTDFDDFKAWLFALKNPANPNQNRVREVDPTITFISDAPDDLPAGHFFYNVPDPIGAIGNAVDGMASFQSTTVGHFENRFECVDCHLFPVATDNDVFAVFPSETIPERSHFVVTPFHELWRKQATLVKVEVPHTNGTLVEDARTFLGFGVRHTGADADALRFFQPVVPDEQFLSDVAAFMHQWDQGLGKAAHFAYLLDDSQDPDALAELETFLLAQASRDPVTGIPNCSVAVLGELPGGGRVGWHLDLDAAGTGTILAGDDVFRVDSDAQPLDRSLQDFITAASSEPSLFLGLPYGMAERFAVDADMDGRKNRDEPDGRKYLVDDLGDVTDPVITRADILWKTTNMARLLVETNEPTTLVVDYVEQGTGTTQTVTSPLFSRVHSVMVGDLRPSTQDHPDGDVTPEDVVYDVTATVTDVGGNTDDDSTITVQTEPFVLPVDSTVTTGTDFDQLQHAHVIDETPVLNVNAPNAQGKVAGSIRLSAALKQGGGSAATDRYFVVRLYTKAGGTGPLVPVSNARLEMGPLTHAAKEIRLNNGTSTRDLEIPGPFLVNQNGTGASGDRTLRFRIDGGVTSGDAVVAVVEAVVEAQAAVVSSTSTGGGGLGAAGATPDQPPGFGPGGGTIGSPPPWDLLEFDAHLEAFAQWDFPRTSEHRFLAEKIVP